MKTDAVFSQGPRFERFARWTEVPIGLLAIAVVPLLILEARASDLLVRQTALVANWAIWLAFCAEYLIKLGLANDRRRYVRDAWWDLALVALSPPFWVPQELDAVRVLRAGRLLRLVRAFRVLRALGLATIGLRATRQALKHRGFHYVAMVAAVVIGVGALAVYHLEQGVNPAISTFGDAAWWAIVTATTVGYGDVSPVTGEGRVVAVLLMLIGIAVIGVFTATLSSFFLDQQREDERSTAEERLRVIEDKLDELLARRKKDRQDQGRDDAPSESS